MSPKISVIIPNLHCPIIDQTLEALHCQNYDSSQTEILVVGLDNYGLVKEDGLVHMISTGEPVNPARARNIGFEHASGDTIIFLDADCIPARDWLCSLVSTSEHIEQLGAASGAMKMISYPFWTLCDQLSTFYEYLAIHKAGFRRTLASFSLLVPRSVIAQAGGFNENFTTAEDLDWTIRIAKAGYHLYFTPEALVTHHPARSTLHDLCQHAFISGTNSIWVRLQHAEWYNTPGWAKLPWSWRLLSPAIALVKTIQILKHSALWRCLYTAPWIFLSKIEWCWGAAHSLSKSLI